MNVRPLHHALLIALLGAAPLALAQTGNAQGNGSNDGASSAMGHSAHGAASAHDSTHRAAGSRARSHTADASRSNGNTEYEAALRRCVQMTGDGRERCIDDAIAAHGS